MKINYNKIGLSIDSGLSDEAVGTAGGYISLLDAPANANVRVKLNDQMADEIPLKPYHAIDAKGVEKIYVSADTIAGETITLVQSDTSEHFKLITPASDVDVSEIASFSNALLTELDKISNPYNAPTNTIVSHNTSTLTTMLSKTLTCDKIRVTLNPNLNQNSGGTSYARVKIGGVVVCNNGAFRSSDGLASTIHEDFILENCSGETLVIEGMSDLGSVSATLREYTLKA